MIPKQHIDRKVARFLFNPLQGRLSGQVLSVKAYFLSTGTLTYLDPILKPSMRERCSLCLIMRTLNTGTLDRSQILLQPALLERYKLFVRYR